MEPISLDPRREFSEKYYTIVQQIFDSLVRFDPDGRIEPSLAKSWRWLDEKTVEFKLRQGVEFHDGEPFTAEAVRFSIEKFIDPATGFPGAGFLDSISGVEVVDPLTVRVKTKFPDGILIHRLAGLVPIMPPKYIEEHGAEHFGRHPMGTGAFRFSGWERGKRITLEANKKWWGGHPKVKRLVFLFLPQKEQVEGLLRGDVDVVTELPGTDTLAVMKSGVARIVKKETFYTVGSSINISAGPMADKRVRQAINYAINKDDLIRYDLLGNGKPLGSLSMSGETGHDKGVRPYPYDPGKARRLLKEAGYPDGLRLKVVVKAQGERTMQIIAKQLEKVGIQLDTRITTDATVIQDIRGQEWDFTFGGCPDPLAHSFFIQFIFLSSLSPYSVQKNPAYDNLLQKMATTLDVKEQDRAAKELDRYIHDEALGVFTYQRVKTYGVRNGVHFVPYVTGMPYFFPSH
ncbi:MAG: ABC transporter substrate-binding protein [Elusimicrobiota bacterium]